MQYGIRISDVMADDAKAVGNQYIFPNSILAYSKCVIASMNKSPSV